MLLATVSQSTGFFFLFISSQEVGERARQNFVVSCLLSCPLSSSFSVVVLLFFGALCASAAHCCRCVCAQLFYFVINELERS